MRAEQPSMVTDGGDHALHVAEIEKVDFLQIEKTTRGTKFNPKTFMCATVQIVRPPLITSSEPTASNGRVGYLIIV